ncbi:MAG: hypothetical protein WDN45_10525 [Caulobacteraceae bacterium]
MSTLQSALDLLKEEFGEFDNVKLLLTPHAGEDPEAVAQEILEIAQGIKAQKYVATADYPEPALVGMTIAR